MAQTNTQSILDVFFDAETMSVHFKENVSIFKKKWKPWSRKSEKLDEQPTKTYLLNVINQLYKEVQESDENFLEIDRKYSKVFQIGPYRTVVVLPPLSDGIEITVVRPIKKLSMKDYNLDETIIDLLKSKSRGILISWAPWEWKTTFAQALVEMYVEMDKIIKTIESPRDLMVPKEVTQYSFSYAPHSEIRDILLLSRPDFTVYDEVRNTDDFHLYKDLRLTWIGLVWITHATNPVDSIQRFLGTIEMWVIPQVIDTVIFIKSWAIQQILQLRQAVKVPHGMESDDLARPVIIVSDYVLQKPVFEIYSYWEQIVVMPLESVEKRESKWMVYEFAQTRIREFLAKKYNFPILAQLTSEKSLKIFVADENKWQIIGKWGAKIMELEKELGVSIDVKNIKDAPYHEDLKVDVQVVQKHKKEAYIISLPEEFANKDISFMLWDEIIQLTTNAQAQIHIKNESVVKGIRKHWIKILK